VKTTAPNNACALRKAGLGDRPVIDLLLAIFETLSRRLVAIAIVSLIGV
jgi:hypothetical protein